MAGLIPRPFIEDLVARTDIVQLIDSRVKLKKAGRNYQACCPFHHEKTPSFSVNPQKQFYHCFGCGVSGNAIGFLMAYDKLEFVDAVEELAALHGLEVPREQSRNGKPQASFQSKRNLYELMDAIAQFYQAQLKRSPEAQQYLAQRGLSEAIINAFEIGYCPDNPNISVLKQFGTNKEEVQKLIDTGMVSHNERGIYNRFRDRIMFPIRDKRGRVVAFGGRTMGDGQPKYLNSPESITYHKSNELYGLFQALKSNDKPEFLLVVEGYVDVVALVQYGVENAVASLGTATTSEQIQQMFRCTEQIICCYDGDNAGRKAAWRALENALPHLQDGRQLKFVFLPDGEDPDSFVRQFGKAGLEDYLKNAQSFSDFFFQTLLAEVDLTTKESKSKLAALALPMIEKIAGETLKLYLRNMLGQKLGILDPALLEAMLPKPTPAQVTAPKQPKIKQTPMRLLVSLLLQNPELVQLVPDLSPLETLNEAGFSLFCEVVAQCREKVGISMGQLLEHWRGEENFRTLEMLANWEHHVAPENVEETFAETLDFLYAKLVEQRIEWLIAKERTDGLLDAEKQELVALISAQ